MRYIMLLLLIISVFGYCAYLKKKWNVRIEFGPAIVSAGISSILFAAGIMNVLKYAAYLLLVTGILLFVLNFRSLLKKRIWIVSVLLLALMFYAAVLAKDAMITSYDNFSHWLTVVKNMVLTDRMPNFSDVLIEFQSYPLGSGLWLYYFGEICMMTEGVLLFAQTAMLLFMLLPLCSFVKKGNRFSGILVAIYAVYVLSTGHGIFALTVDTLLAAVGVACMAIIAYEKENPERALAEIAPLLILEVQIKNSGIFFALVCMIYFAVTHWNAIKRTKKIRRGFFVYDVVLPLFSMFLWKQHVKLVFAYGEYAKHSMSVEYYKLIFGDKTPEIIAQMAKDVLGAATVISLTERVAMCMLLIFTGALIAYILCSLKNKAIVKSGMKVAVSVWCIYIVYTFFVFCMYVFSMTYSEYMSTDLPSFNRYMETLIAFIAGIVVIYVIENKGDKKKLIIPVLCFLFVFLVFGKQKAQLLPGYEDPLTRRAQLQELLKENGVSEGASCTIYAKSASVGGYLYYYSRYELWTDRIYVVTKDDGYDRLRDAALQSDYLVVWDQGKAVNKYLKEIGRKDLKSQEKIVIGK